MTNRWSASSGGRLVQDLECALVGRRGCEVFGDGLGMARRGLHWRHSRRRRWGLVGDQGSSLATRDVEGRGEQAQVAVGEAGGASGDVEAEANWPRDRSETPSGASASRKRKVPC